MRDALRRELALDDISEEHRRLLTEKLIETGQAESAKDSENKMFIAQQADGTRKTVVVLAVISVVVAVVPADGRMSLNMKRNGQTRERPTSASNLPLILT